MLETLQDVQLAELSYQTSDGARLCFERASVPSAARQAILTTLGWLIPDHYLPPNLEVEPCRVVSNGDASRYLPTNLTPQVLNSG